jgi:hypothetical protein
VSASIRCWATTSVAVLCACAAPGCVIDPPDLSGKECEADIECGLLSCINNVCGDAGDEGEGEGEEGEGEGEGEEGEGEGEEGEGEGEGEGEEGEGEGEGEPDVDSPFEAWSADQPDAGENQNCLATLYQETNAPRQWRDRGCSELFPFVCDLPFGADAPDGCELVDIGKEVAFCATLSTFDDAQATCATVDGALVRIENIAQNEALEAEAFVRFPAEPGVVFLGADDRGSEGQFTWLDGDLLFTPSAFTPWEFGGAPDDGAGVNGPSEDCQELGMEADDKGTWQDIRCTQSSPYVCSVPGEDFGECTPVVVGERSFAVCITPLVVDAAAEACAGLGGSLARIDTREETQAITDAADVLLIVEDMLIGGSDAEEEGVWRWPDGEVFEDLRFVE